MMAASLNMSSLPLSLGLRRLAAPEFGVGNRKRAERKGSVKPWQSGLSGAGYTPPPMAVPKKKTSKSRRDKRRATHRLEAPRVNTCPQCGRPKQPHRMCPNCKTYAGREIEPLRTPTP